MKISAINSFSNQVNFKSKRNSDTEYENPISRSTERNLAILGSVGGSAVVGAILGGLTTCLETKDVTGGFFKRHKTAAIVGAAAAAVSLIFTLPSALYNRKVSAYIKEKEMDVFSRDRELKSNLTEEVHTEVKDPDVDLDKKLDDNLKLQMANRGNAIGIANVTPQS
ncbi:MAG: hypothetical protein PHC64_07735 [Candidatus Gastranaerophilales bacterium]|nr:hypothetical protein [Candidatus Gastranaerophilales bacterium]